MEKLTVLIRKLASSVVLNSAAVNASGLNSGRMGCSLALYEASQVLGDDYLEDEEIRRIDRLYEETKNIPPAGSTLVPGRKGDFFGRPSK